MNGFLNKSVVKSKASDTTRIVFPGSIQCDGTPSYTAGKFLGSFIVPYTGIYRIKAETNIGGTTGNAGYAFAVITTGRDILSDEKRSTTLIKMPGPAAGTVVDCTGIGSLPIVVSTGPSFGINTWGSITDQDVWLEEGALCSMYVYRSGTSTTAPGPGARNIRICYDELTISLEGAKV